MQLCLRWFPGGGGRGPLRVATCAPSVYKAKKLLMLQLRFGWYVEGFVGADMVGPPFYKRVSLCTPHVAWWNVRCGWITTQDTWPWKLRQVFGKYYKLVLTV